MESEPMSPAPLLSVRDLAVAFPGPTDPLMVVDGVSFDIAPGETLGLVGESGCGKTMTALSLMRLLPTSGRIERGNIIFQGKNLGGLPESGPSSMESLRGRHISMIFQDPGAALNPVYPVGTQIGEMYEIHLGLSRREASIKAVSMLEKVGIPDPGLRAGSYPHELSGGMRQRVMIAMALACEPALLIADEPTTALDVTIQAQILDLILEMQTRLGMAVLFISHNLGVVARVADEVAVMYSGRIVEQARAGDIFDNPGHPYTKGLIRTLPQIGHRVERMATIPGFVPGPGHRPPGCHFAERCEIAVPECLKNDPRLEAHREHHDAHHMVACLKEAS
ncbi:MAG: ABC transporter ATP-binding protein [Rhodospirillaceae bacterium]|nr:ABC transporter ATP-binding protein [Rhodospirillaceae bacterium]